MVEQSIEAALVVSSSLTLGIKYDMIDVLEVVDRNRLGRFSIAYWYKFKSCHLYFIIFFPGWLTKYACAKREARTKSAPLRSKVCGGANS